MNSKTFCAATWMHLNTTPSGNLEPCCVWKANPQDRKYRFTKFDEWVNSDMLKAVRRDLHNGVARSECSNCYVLEKGGHSSLRLRYNEFFSNYKDYASFDTVNWTAKAEDFVTLELKLGNLCDLKCVMCCGENSSQIMTEYKQHKDKFDKIRIHSANDLETDFTWPLSPEFNVFLDKFKDNLKFIELTGGEPTLIPYVEDFLNNLTKPEDVVLSLVTNANRYNPRLFQTLAKFKFVNIALSLEGIEAHNEMIRFNSKWESINDNILRYQAMPNIAIIVNHVLQAFSVTTVIPLIKWCAANNIKLSLTVLDGPWQLRINSVPPERIEQFRQELIAIHAVNPVVVDSILNILKEYKYNEDSCARRKEYTALLDELRGTQLSSII